MEDFLRQNWFKLAVVIINVVFGVYYFAAIQSQKHEPTEKLANLLALQAKCSDKAASFYKQGGYEEGQNTTTGPWYSYENHWNTKLGKCFIEITATTLVKDAIMFVQINIFDAFEGKTFATYIGHSICDVRITKNPTLVCPLKSGPP